MFPPSASVVRRNREQSRVRLRLNRVTTRNFGEIAVNGLIYLVGLIVVVIAVLSFFGMH